MVCEGQTQMTGAGAMYWLLPTSAAPIARWSPYLRSEKQGANESDIIDDPIIDHITFYYSSDFTLLSSIFTPLSNPFLFYLLLLLPSAPVLSSPSPLPRSPSRDKLWCDETRRDGRIYTCMCLCGCDLLRTMMKLTSKTCIYLFVMCDGDLSTYFFSSFQPHPIGINGCVSLRLECKGPWNWCQQCPLWSPETAAWHFRLYVPVTAFAWYY